MGELATIPRQPASSIIRGQLNPWSLSPGTNALRLAMPKTSGAIDNPWRQQAEN